MNICEDLNIFIHIYLRIKRHEQIWHIQHSSLALQSQSDFYRCLHYKTPPIQTLPEKYSSCIRVVSLWKHEEHLHNDNDS